jgi:hypothetical protein
MRALYRRSLPQDRKTAGCSIGMVGCLQLLLIELLRFHFATRGQIKIMPALDRNLPVTILHGRSSIEHAYLIAGSVKIV